MKKILFLNTIMPVMLQIMTIISGLVIPRLILSYYGSEVNGLISSITQFLGIISFLELGIGSVIKFNFYKPLSESDKNTLSGVYVSATRFFRKLAVLLLFYIVILVIIYPQLIDRRFDFFYTALLIVAISVSSFSQYYFGQVNQILLSADQRTYIQTAAQIISIVLNTVVSAILICAGAGIHAVKFSTSFILLLRPVFLNLYVKKHYDINFHFEYKGEPLKQKWNAVAQHIAAVILDGTDVIVLTLFSTLSNVSIYSTSNMVISGVKSLLMSASGGIEAYIGAIQARQDKENLQKTFSLTEWALHTATTFFFSCTIILIVPFVLVYTKGITDADYNAPLFAFLMCLANAFHCYRLPYSIVILSAGHYKQTQGSYIIAAVINIVISVVFVVAFGLVGVAIGTLAALFFQNIWMMVYCYKNLLGRPLKSYCKQIAVDCISIAVIFAVSKIFSMTTDTYFSWVILAIEMAATAIVIIFIINYFTYKKTLVEFIGLLHKRRAA